MAANKELSTPLSARPRYRGGSSNKWWRVDVFYDREQAAWKAARSWGRVGAAGQSVSHAYITREKAVTIARAFWIAGKLAKGYKVESGDEELLIGLVDPLVQAAKILKSAVADVAQAGRIANLLADKRRAPFRVTAGEMSMVITAYCAGGGSSSGNSPSPARRAADFSPPERKIVLIDEEDS